MPVRTGIRTGSSVTHLQWCPPCEEITTMAAKKTKTSTKKAAKSTKKAGSKKSKK
jgi:hypothetical protein